MFDEKWYKGDGIGVAEYDGDIGCLFLLLLKVLELLLCPLIRHFNGDLLQGKDNFL